MPFVSRLLLIGLLFITSFATAGERGMFLASAADENAILAIQSAFAGRNWKIIAADNESVTGYLQAQRKTATLKIFKDGENLGFDCDCYQQVIGPNMSPRGAEMISEKHTPERWLNNLRKDFLLHIALMNRACEEPEEGLSIKARLLQLEDLRKSGLLDTREYKTRKDQILSEL